MRTLRFPVAGDYTLSQISDAITFQEQHACEFLDSKIAYEDGSVVNLVTFKQFDEPITVKPLILKEKSQGSPDNKFWEGVMAADNTLVVVLAGRT